MAINQKTGLEEVTPTGVNINGVSDSQTPVGAQSMTGNQGGLSDVQAGGIQAIYKANLAKGMSPLQAKEAIQTNPAFEKAKAQYNAPAPVAQPMQDFSKGQQVNQAGEEINAPITTTTAPTTGTISEGNIKTTPNYDSSIGRESEIQANLSNITASSPTLLQDRNAFNQSFGYETADKGKKALLDKFFQGSVQKPVLSSSDYFNQIAQGQKSSDPSITGTNAYKQASADWAKASQYTTASGQQIYGAMTSGQLLPGSNAWNYLQQVNPLAIKRANEIKTFAYSAQNINDNTSSMLSSKDNKRLADIIPSDGKQTIADAVKPMVEISQNLMSGVDIAFDEARTALNNPEITKKRDEMTAAQNDYQTAMNKRAVTLKNMRLEMEKAGNSSAYIHAKLTDAGYQMDDEIANLKSRYENSQAVLTNSSASILQNLGLEKDRASLQSDLLQNVTKAYQPIVDTAVTQEQRTYDEQQKRTEEAWHNPKLDATDPGIRNLAINNAVDEMYKMYANAGVVAQNSPAQLQEWVKSEVAKGRSAGEVLTEMNKNFQSKPEWQAYVSSKTKQQPVWQEWEDATGKHAGWVTPGVNPSPYSPIPSTPTTSPVKPTGVMKNVTLGNKNVIVDSSVSSSLEQANNELQAAGIPVASAKGYRDQVATIKEMADKFGIQFNANNPSETAQLLRDKGHQVSNPGQSKHETGMAVDIYKDGSLSKVSPQQEAILNKNGWFSAGIPGDAGHFEFRGVQQGKQYSESDIALLASVKADKNGQVLLAQNGLSIDDKAKFDQGLLPPTQSQKTQMQGLIDNINSLLNDEEGLKWISGKTGVGSDYIIHPGFDARTKLDAIIGELTLDNTGKLKGTLSNSDMELLKTSSVGIKAGNSEEMIRSRLNKIKELMLSKSHNIGSVVDSSTASTVASNPLGLDL